MRATERNNSMNQSAKNLRKDSTDAEKALWRQLRNRQLANHKFRRQHPIPPYVVDFICMEKRLIIEVDGGQHAAQQTYDTKRSLFLENQGYQVLRFWNNEVLQELDGVLEKILMVLDVPSP